MICLGRNFTRTVQCKGMFVYHNKKVLKQTDLKNEIKHPKSEDLCSIFLRSKEIQARVCAKPKL